jgi:hypothetical protein
MPYKQEDQDAELFLEYVGVKVYRVYRNDNIEEGTRDFNFDTKINSEEYGSFSIVELARRLSIDTPTWYSSDETKKYILREAIDAGLIITPEDK